MAWVIMPLLGCNLLWASLFGFFGKKTPKTVSYPNYKRKRAHLYLKRNWVQFCSTNLGLLLSTNLSFSSAFWTDSKKQLGKKKGPIESLKNFVCRKAQQIWSFSFAFLGFLPGVLFFDVGSFALVMLLEFNPSFAFWSWVNYGILLGLFVFFSTELELGFVCFVATVESLLPATPLRDWDSLLRRRRRSWWVGRWTGKWMQNSAGFGEWKPWWW